VGWTEIDGILTPLFPYTNAVGKSVLECLAGVPFSEKPGEVDVKVRVSGGGFDKEVATKINIVHAELDRQSELLNLPANRVIPSSEEEVLR